MDMQVISKAPVALTARQVSLRLKRLDPRWKLAPGGQRIAARFAFADFTQTSAFVIAVMSLSACNDHHPDVSFGYNNCDIAYSTHDAGGLSEKDFACADMIDALMRDKKAEAGAQDSNFSSAYVSRQPDASGAVHYSEAEHGVWAELHARQMASVRGRACDEYLHGLELLNLPGDRVPQLPDVSRVLKRETGWEVACVPALIPATDFFQLLADRRFPAATFVRRREELNYLREPDLFHELFGHAPLLTNQYFADFIQTYGQLALAASEEDREFLARLFWFTVEFGLIQPRGSERRIYGGGILSSIGETRAALEGNAERRPFNVMDALRTPYRIDIMQPVYYVIEDFRELYELTRGDLMAQVREARKLGLYAPQYPEKAA